MDNIDFKKQLNLIKRQLKNNKRKMKLNKKQKQETAYKNNVLYLYSQVKKALDKERIYFSVKEEHKNIASKFFLNITEDWSDFPYIYYNIKITKRGLRKLLKEVERIKRKE